jgi:DNA-binding MarR family transcriptional regulator
VSDIAPAAVATTRPPALLAMPTYLVSKLGRFAQRLTQESIAEHGLLLPHFSVLATLDEHGPLAQHELADRLGLNRSHLVHYVDDLEGRKAIRRERDPEDRRRQVLTLTPAGQILLSELQGPINGAQRQFLEPLSAEERTVLIGLVTRLLDNASQASAAPGGALASGDC